MRRGPAAAATGRVMKASTVVPVGVEKKKGSKKRAESVKAPTTQEPEQRKRAKRTDKTLYKHAGRAVEMTITCPCHFALGPRLSRRASTALRCER